MYHVSQTASPNIQYLHHRSAHTHTHAHIRTHAPPSAVYPGDARCRVQQAHSKWHEEGGNGLLDLMMLSDDCYALTSKASERASRYDDEGVNDRWGNFAVSMVTGWQDTVASIVGF